MIECVLIPTYCVKRLGYKFVFETCARVIFAAVHVGSSAAVYDSPEFAIIINERIPSTLCAFWCDLVC